MKAAVCYGANQPVAIEEVDVPDPGQGEVAIRLMASGVCHSDWHVVKGEWGDRQYPTILGHEGAGIVEATGPDVANLKKGDHVILSWKTSCGFCEMCQQGWPNLCARSPMPRSRPTVRRTGATVNRMTGLGTMSTYTVVPEVAAVRISEDIPFAQAALIGCGVTTGVGAVLNTARVQAGTTVAVFGAGGVGLNCVQGAAIAGASAIISVDMLDNKLALAREFGATHVVNASREDPVRRIQELTGGEGVHYAFEAIGLVEAPFVQSVLCTRRRGITVWVGHAPLDTPVTIDARALIMEKTIIASFYGSARPHVDFPRILDLYRAGKLKLDELITRRFPLDGVNEAFGVLARGEVARSVLVMNGA